MTTAPEKNALQDLQNELEELLKALPGDAAAHRQTVEMLKAKGLSDQAIAEFLRGTS